MPSAVQAIVLQFNCILFSSENQIILLKAIHSSEVPCTNHSVVIIIATNSAQVVANFDWFLIDLS
jgi:hypothetical protein